MVDAVGAQDKQKARHAFRKIAAKGARLIDTRKLAGISHLKSVGTLNDDIMQGNPDVVTADLLVE